MRKLIVVSLHLLYWAPKFINIISYFAVLVSTTTKASALNSSIKIQAISLITEFIGFYIFYLYLFPVFLAKKKHALFIVYGLVTWVILLLPVLIVYIHLIPTSPYNSVSVFNVPLLGGIIIAINTLISVIIGSLFRGSITWYSEIRLKEQLVKKNLQSELALLKAQVNPHFLFNTINNIDVLIEKDPKTASKYLKQLSEIMRFMLYETSPDFIPLTTELEYIIKYIELQKIRTANERFVNFTVIGASEKLMIAPAIFIPFIENAFKHTTNKKIENAINIKFEIVEKYISFICLNFFDNSKMFAQEKSGLGIDLIKQRLKLIYSDKYELEIIKTNNQFEVKLKIKTI
jgi:two-component system, LytTR family, sensor kinase